eukprot:8732162-Pyramimonas_sp.AAC.1
MILSDPKYDWVRKAVEAFRHIPRLSFFGMFPCVGGFEQKEKLGRFRPWDKDCAICNIAHPSCTSTVGNRIGLYVVTCLTTVGLPLFGHIPSMFTLGISINYSKWFYC